MSKRDYSKYDFTKFDYSKKWNLYIDADTIVYSTAAMCSKEPLIVTHKRTGRTKYFNSFSEFNDFITHDEKGSKFSISEFEIPVLRHAYGNINKKVESILKLDWVDKYNFYVGGDGNFRRGIDPEYKGNRPPKPALFAYCYEHFVRKYKPIICHGSEAEDFCLADALSDDVGVISCVDKDLFNQSGYFINYDNLDMGVFWISPEQAFYNLCVQLMIGDRSCDNIKGIDFVSDELKQKYKIKTKSIGDGTAKNLLNGLESSVELMKDRLVDVYKLSYGDRWKDALDFTGKLIYITPKRDQIFDVNKFLEGCDYE